MDAYEPLTPSQSERVVHVLKKMGYKLARYYDEDYKKYINISYDRTFLMFIDDDPSFLLNALIEGEFNTNTPISSPKSGSKRIKWKQNNPIRIEVLKSCLESIYADLFLSKIASVTGIKKMTVWHALYTELQAIVNDGTTAF